MTATAKRRLVPLILMLLTIALFAGAIGSAAAQPAQPLLMTGKKTLFQRVLTRPGAELVKQPGDAKGTPVPAFSQYYVYERQTGSGGREWLRVGSGSRGRIDGWLAAEATIPWKQQMALVFTNPAGRERVLLFEDRKTAVDLLKAPDPAAAVAPIRAAVKSGAGDPRVISIEPETYVDIEKRFYLLPILDAQEVDTGTGFRVRVLDVASVSQRKDDRSPAEAAAQQKPKEAVLRTFSAALVFVIDSTISMGPYIDRTREGVKRIYDAVAAAGLLNQVRFGLVAYRSSTEAVPQLEYVAKVYADPNEVKDGKDFLARVAGLQPAKVSSKKFDEDPYAGLMTAVRQIKWDSFGGRYVVLITDAGAIAGDDPLSTTKLNAQQVRLELERLGIALSALHLKTPEGKRNHKSAERQYLEATLNPVVDRSLYYPVEGGSVERFGSQIDTLADAIVAQVQGASKGEMVPGSVRAAKAAPATDPAQAETRIREDARLLGLAMQLAYLGRVQGTAAPPVFQASLADRDFADLARATTEVRVLLTKNQLSDLAQVVESILTAGEEAQRTSTADFFDLIRSAAANLARDPAALRDPAATRLGQLGLLGEYLEDLPYKSDVMGLSRDIWVSWSVTEQEELLDKLRRKLRLYQIYHDDVDRWVTLAPGADPGDAVYPVPLQALP
jgi:hypothetical protein